MGHGRLTAMAAGTLGALAIAASGASAAGPVTAERAAANCPATFHVLHNDQIGRLELRKGHYRIRLLDDQKLTCQRASSLFAQFLQDFDGKLPSPWRVIVAKSMFKRGPGDGFKVKRVGSQSGGGGGSHPNGDHTRCPTFQVLHNDMIDNVSFRRGTYQMVAYGNFTCQRATRKFARFLELGNTPSPWRIRTKNGTFKRGKVRKFHVNFWQN